jgi:uncharacterized protein YggE
MHPNPPLIRVQGSGRVSSTPDTVILGLELISEHRDYGKATADAARKLELLRASLPKADLTVEQLKTESFNVGVERDYEEHKYIFRGYSVKHSLSLRLPFDPSHLGRVLAAVTASNAKASLSLSFTVAEPEAVKRRVLEAAVRNARSRAEVIATAAGQKLGAIRAIEYGHTEILIRSEPLSLSSACESSTMDMDLNPSDIESDDTVLVAWELEAGS